MFYGEMKFIWRYFGLLFLNCVQRSIVALLNDRTKFTTHNWKFLLTTNILFCCPSLSTDTTKVRVSNSKEY